MEWVDKCYPDFAPSETTIKMWYTDFKRGPTDTNDAECSGHPNSADVPENTKDNSINSFCPIVNWSCVR